MIEPPPFRKREQSFARFFEKRHEDNTSFGAVPVRMCNTVTQTGVGL
jgi:hypothetical protein